MHTTHTQLKSLQTVYLQYVQNILDIKKNLQRTSKPSLHLGISVDIFKFKFSISWSLYSLLLFKQKGF